MGTNYYIKVGQGIGKPKKEMHIGKQSAGWRFFARLDEDIPCESFEDYINFIRKYKIYDEYLRKVPLTLFKKSITSRKNDLKHEEYYRTSKIFCIDYWPECDFTRDEFS